MGKISSKTSVSIEFISEKISSFYSLSLIFFAFKSKKSVIAAAGLLEKIMET